MSPGCTPRKRKGASGSRDAPLDGPLLEVQRPPHRLRDRARHSCTPSTACRSRLERGKTLGVVGESGSGKSVLSRSIMGLLPEATSTRTGSIHFEGHEIVDAPARRAARALGHADGDGVPGPDDLAQPGDEDRQADHRVAASTTSTSARSYANETALSLLQSVGIPEAERRLREYPHQLSGGMRQRVMIAIALACGPKLLFADEPTTALDVTVQAQILDLLQEQQRERYMAMILVTHDLGVVAGRADDIAVMYAGRIVEKAPTRTLFSEMRHPYTEALLQVDPEARAAEPHPARRDRRPAARPRQPAARVQVRAALPVRAGALPRPRSPPLIDADDARPLLPLLLPGRHRRGRDALGAQPRRGRDRGRHAGRGRRAARSSPSGRRWS